MTARASSAAADKPRLLLVVNSHASGMSAELRDRAVSVLGRTYAVGIVDSASPSQSTEASRRAAAEGVAVVAVLGGDGAARSVAEGIADTDTALCCLPAGSRNVFARMLDAPPGPVAAAERLAEGVVRERRVDLGTIAGRPFLFAASVGLSARVNEELNRRPKLKAGLGAAYGAVTALRTGLAYLVRPPRMRLSAGERKLEAVSLIV
jgi:diacylglycerol kinase family enzyme